MIGYWGEKGKEIITRCGGWRLSSNKEGKVLLREVGRAKFTNKLITCLEL